MNVNWVNDKINISWMNDKMAISPEVRWSRMNYFHEYLFLYSYKQVIPRIKSFYYDVVKNK